MDIVCPVKEHDFDRFKLLFRSLEKFSIDPFKLYLVSPSGESPIYSNKIVPIKDSKLDPSIVHKKYIKEGWWKQQIIKLLSFKFCESPYILSLDADCFAVKPFHFSEFLYQKKIKTKIASGGSWDHWYIGSADLLKLDLNFNWKENRVGVTPFIFSQDILAGLDKYLKSLYGKNYVKNLLDHTKVNHENGTIWSEYCLYHIYGMHTGFWQRYHHGDANFNLSGNCFWNSEQVKTWDPEKSFLNPKFYFSVAQSTAGKPASWIKERIEKYVC